MKNRGWNLDKINPDKAIQFVTEKIKKIILARKGRDIPFARNSD